MNAALAAGSHATDTHHREMISRNCLLSLAPGFSRVLAPHLRQNRFNGFVRLRQHAAGTKPLKRLSLRPLFPTRLKPGANESVLAEGPCLLIMLSLILLFTFTACRTAPPPRIDTSAPGWTQRSGQAAWTPARDAGEVVIDLNVWTRAQSECVLDVSKAALPFVFAHITAGTWRIDTASGEHHSAPGSPPARVSWLQLARALAGQTPAAPWRFERRDSTEWQLTNPRTGERFDGSLTP